MGPTPSWTCSADAGCTCSSTRRRESSDVRQDTVIDLRTRHTATANVLDDETDNDVVVVPGAVVTAGDGGVIAQFTGGRSQAHA